MVQDVDGIAAAVTQIRWHLTPRIPGARVIRKDGAVAIVTGFPSPAFNGVWCERSDVPAASAGALLGEVAGTGLPFFVESRPASRALIARLAADRGMVHTGESPVMALNAQDRPEGPSAPEGVSIRELAPHEAPVHAELVSAVFGLPEAALLKLVSEDTLAQDWFRCYIAEADGRPVATGVGVTLGAYTSISNVATLPAFRRRGVAAAIMVRAIADGHAAGARCCCLHSTEEGIGLYRALGFEVVEEWSQWISAS